MAQVQSRKSDLYSQKQSIRDELSAPLHLESAGDALIKHLARKQTNTRTSLREQLQIVQHFEKGFRLSPDDRKGVACLEEFRKRVPEEPEAASSGTRRQVRDLDELMSATGLSRHELELGLCEKPNSAVSQLYLFAIGNKRRASDEPPERRWRQHPMNRLKEIEEECFGQAKGAEGPGEEAKREDGRRRKRRKRKRKGAKGPGGPWEEGKRALEGGAPEAPVPCEGKGPPRAACPRPSLWDVKDMRKWAESKEVGCRAPGLYTIRDGEIIKLGGRREGGEAT